MKKTLILALSVFSLLPSHQVLADIVSEIRTDNSRGLLLFNGIKEDSEDSVGAGFESVAEYNALPWLTLRGRYTNGNFKKTFNQLDTSTGNIKLVNYDSPFTVATLGFRLNYDLSDKFNTSVQVDGLTRTRDGVTEKGYRITPMMSYRYSDTLSLRALIEFESSEINSIDRLHPEGKLQKKGTSTSASEGAIYLTYNVTSQFAIDVKLASGLSQDAGDFSLEPQFYYHFTNGISIKGYTSPEFDIYGVGINYYF
jgi:hypothetical protein